MVWRTLESEYRKYKKYRKHKIYKKYKKVSSPVLKKSHHMILFLCTNGVVKQISIATFFVICLVHLVVSGGPVSKILLILV